MSGVEELNCCNKDETCPNFMINRKQAVLYGNQGNYVDCVKTYEVALKEYEESIYSKELNHKYVNFIPFCLSELGVLHARHSNIDESIKVFQKAINELQNLLNMCANSEVCKRDTSYTKQTNILLIETKKHLATVYKSAGYIQEAIDLFYELFNAFQSDTTLSNNELLFSDCCYHLAELLNSQNRFDEAEPLARECLEIRRKLYNINQSDQQSDKKYTCRRYLEVAMALCLLGATIASPSIGNYDEAEECINEAISISNKCPQLESEIRGQMDEDVCLKSILASIQAAREQSINNTN